MRVVIDDGGTLGVMDTRDAIQEARNRGLDLVEIAPSAQPPVAKIIDYGKFLYEQKKKAHEAKKKQVTVQVKEIKFRPGTDDHDYEYRMENARKWLIEGDKVRAAIAFRGREMSHRELGAKILKRLTEELADLATSRSPEDGRLSDVHHLCPEKGKTPRRAKHISVAADKRRRGREAQEGKGREKAGRKGQSRAKERRRDILGYMR